ncbi:MAG: ferric reductase-like transmembrane domain-containing protein [Pseudomonadota bacterium]
MLSLQLVVLALAITPLRRWLPYASLRRWLVSQRRAVGVASFAYLALHVCAYLWRQPWSRVLTEGASAAYLSAWMGAAIMLLLAVTSNDRSVRRLGARWKRLHRGAYVAASLAFAHWVLTAYDPRMAYGWLLVLLLIEASRLLPSSTAEA